VKKGLAQILDDLDHRDWLEKAFDEVFAKKKKAPRVIDYFYASWAGECPRYIQYMMNGMIHDDIDPQSQRRLDNGTYMHERYGDYFESIKRLRAREPAFRGEFDGVTISGRGDLIVLDDNIQDVLIEMKSINSRLFNGILTAPREIDVLQWNLCSKALQISSGVILYENKDTQGLKYHFVTFNMDKYTQTVDKFKEINRCNQRGILVAKPAICTNPKYCRAKSFCKQEKFK